MPKISLELRMNLENVTNLKPENMDDFRWYLKIKCSNCGETNDRWNYVTLEECREMPGSRGKANLIEKCKLCNRQNSLDIIKDSIKAYAIEKNLEWQSMIVFDCRGLEPVDFDPRIGWCAEGNESQTCFNDVNLSEKEWADYDEKLQQSVEMNSFRFASLDEEEDWLDREVQAGGLNSMEVVAREASKKRKSVRMNESHESASSSSITISSPKRASKPVSSDKSPNETDFATCWFDFDSDTDVHNKPNFNFTPTFDDVPCRLSSSNDVPLIEIPSPINRYLRDYQRCGVQFLFDHYVLNEGAILADDMGLGKTVQVIAFLAAIQHKSGTNVDLLRLKPAFLRKLDSDEGYAKQEESEFDDNIRKPSLIIAPACVLCNWIQELNTWGHFSIGKFHGSSKDEIRSKLRRNKLDVVVTTFETFRDCAEILNSFAFECVIVDEVHKIKEPKSRLTQSLKSMKCKRRFGLTGTPLQNNILEFWCILDWANPSCLGTKEQFRQQFAELIEERQRHRLVKRRLAASKRKCEEFSKLRDKWVKRRTKSLIADQLPKKEDFVLFCPITDLQSTVYQSVLNCSDMILVRSQYDKCTCGSKKLKGNCCYKENKEGVKVKALTLSLLQFMLKIANHIGLLLPSLVRSRTTNNEIFSDDDIFNMAFENSPSIKHLTLPERYSALSAVENSGKMMILERLLKTFKGNNDKVLLFSYSVRLLEILERFVVERSYKFRKIDGQTKPEARLSYVAEFNNDPNIFVFLISTKAGGVGLNIIGANRVIIFDPNWNPSHDLQAQDRAYRIGQSRDVDVYRFVTVGTIEEIIYLRQVFKQNVSNIAVQSNNCKRLFNREDVFGFSRLFELRLDFISLTQRLLSRYANVQKKFDDCLTVDYDQVNRESDEDEQSISEKELEGRSSEDDEHGLSYVFDQISSDFKHPNDVDERRNALISNLGATFIHRNQELVGDDPIEKHIAECADKDVYELCQHSQELAQDFCPPLKKNNLSKKSTSPLKQSYRIGSSNVVVGCTPPAIKRRIFLELSESLKCGEVELANKVLNMNENERRMLLREFYSKKLPETLLNEIFNNERTSSMSVKLTEKNSSVAQIFDRPVHEDDLFSLKSSRASSSKNCSKPVKNHSKTFASTSAETLVSSRIDILDDLIDYNFTQVRLPPPSCSTKNDPLDELLSSKRPSNVIHDRSEKMQLVESIPILDDLLKL